MGTEAHTACMDVDSLVPSSSVASGKTVASTTRNMVMALTPYNPSPRIAKGVEIFKKERRCSSSLVGTARQCRKSVVATTSGPPASLAAASKGRPHMMDIPGSLPRR
jgi:hypothetical protein